ncbi:MAG: DUF3788 domain-containing protein [Firmicutes bacterium]|nr:DUF3788 domain-containing protein [Bacillota bacterium]
MKTEALSALGEKALYPNEDALSFVLNEAYPIWQDLKAHISSAYKNVSEEWKFYGKASGWTLAVSSGKRRLFHFVPMVGYFTLCFTLGEKAVSALQNSTLPQHIKELLPTEKACMCGYDFRYDIKTQNDLSHAIKLLEIKFHN